MDTPIAFKKKTGGNMFVEPGFQKRLTDEQLSTLYQNCIKMSIGNKINPQNSWSLDLIDHMVDVLSEGRLDQEEGEMTNFQKVCCIVLIVAHVFQASSTLDAGTRIYAARVDSVHSDTYKVLGGLSRTQAQSRDDEEDAEIDGDEDSEEKEAVEKKKRKRGWTALENVVSAKDTRSIDQHSLENAGVDPIFRKSTQAFESGGARGLLLNMIGTNIASVPQPTSAVEKQGLLPLINILTSAVGDHPLCPTFQNLEKEYYGPSEDDETAELEDVDDFADDNFDGYADMALPGFEEVDVPIPSTPPPAPQPIVFEPEIISLMSPILPNAKPLPNAPELLDRGFSGFRTFGTSQAKESAPRKKKERFLFDFLTMEEIDTAKAFKKAARTTNKLTKATLDKQNISTTTLPVDQHYNPESLIRLFLKPSFKLRNRRFALRQAPGDLSDISDSDEANLSEADDLGFAPLDYDENEGGENDVHARTLELVAEPVRAEALAIDYARVAKQVNVHKLKQDLWKGFIPDARESDRMTESTPFSEAISAVAKEIPENERRNLSVPFCFVCLLHLANEKVLEIHQKDELSNLLIIQEPEPAP